MPIFIYSICLLFFFTLILGLTILELEEIFGRKLT